MEKEVEIVEREFLGGVCVVFSRMKGVGWCVQMYGRGREDEKELGGCLLV